MEPPGQKHRFVNRVVVFEEEEVGTGIAGDGARGKRRGFSRGAAARHSQSARDHTGNPEIRCFPRKNRVEPGDLRAKWIFWGGGGGGVDLGEAQ